MGYRVEYRPIKKVRNAEKNRAGLLAMTAGCFLLFLLFIHNVWPQGEEILKCLFFSGDYAVTVAALEDLAVELGEGEQLSSALESFCKKVIEYAQFPYH